MLQKNKTFDFDTFIVDYDLDGNQTLMLESMLLLLTTSVDKKDYEKYVNKIIKYLLHDYRINMGHSLSATAKLEIDELDVQDMKDFITDCEEYIIGEAPAEALPLIVTVKGVKRKEL